MRILWTVRRLITSGMTLSAVAGIAVNSIAATKSAQMQYADSVKVDMGPDVEIAADAAGGALSVEPTIAIRDSMVLVAWNDSRGGHIHRGYHDVATAVSLDRGGTFR